MRTCHNGSRCFATLNPSPKLTRFIMAPSKPYSCKRAKTLLRFVEPEARGVENDACLESKGRNPASIFFFVPRASALLKNVTRTGFLNPFNNWLYLESNVFFSAYMNCSTVFSAFLTGSSFYAALSRCERIEKQKWMRLKKALGPALSSGFF